MLSVDQIKVTSPILIWILDYVLDDFAHEKIFIVQVKIVKLVQIKKRTKVRVRSWEFHISFSIFYRKWPFVHASTRDAYNLYSVNFLNHRFHTIGKYVQNYRYRLPTGNANIGPIPIIGQSLVLNTLIVLKELFFRPVTWRKYLGLTSLWFCRDVARNTDFRQHYSICAFSKL